MNDTHSTFGLALALLLAATPAFAQQQKPDEQAPAANPLLDLPPMDKLPIVANPGAPVNAPTPTTSVTVNLLRLMVAKKLLSEDEAQGLIQQAQAEAETAKAAQMEDAAFSGSPDDVRVTYIPDNIKQQMREDIRKDIMAQAKSEKWAAPGSAAEWTERMKWFGDVRFRWRTDQYPVGNDNTGAFPNFNVINTGAPFDIAGTLFSPQYNVDQQRNRFQIRARLGTEATLGEGWYAGIAFGTGETNTPVTQNQGLGTANGGQGGNFSKYALWLDRAFIRYEFGSDLKDNANFYFGRFNNPFFNTEMIWNDNLGFDGLAFTGRKQVNDQFTLFGAAGAFPVFNTDLNFSSNQPSKFESTDKYLYGAQLGVEFKLDDKIKAKIAAAYYDFQDIEGRLSDPFIPLTAQDAGNTDNTRPAFAQKGNTYRTLRNIIPSAINGFGTSMQYQYFGLASKFADAAITGRIDIDTWEPYRLSVIGEFIKNTAWNKEDISAIAINNRGANAAQGNIGEYAGGDTAWLMKLEFGKAKFEKAGDWSAFIDYRYVESDSVVDGFNDNDWGGGGTNMEGYTIGGHIALSPSVRLGARWMSTTQIAGPPFKTDIFMIDITAKF